MMLTFSQRVMNDLKRKGDDMERITGLSHELQNLLNVRRKAPSLIDRTTFLSTRHTWHFVFTSVQQYEANAEKYNSTLEDAGTTVEKKPRVFSLADAIETEVQIYSTENTNVSYSLQVNDLTSWKLLQERNLVNQFAEATAENAQRQKQMDLAKNLILQVIQKVTKIKRIYDKFCVS